MSAEAFSARLQHTEFANRIAAALGLSPQDEIPFTVLVETAAALRERAGAAEADAFERAAKVCESRARSLRHDSHDHHAANEAQKCAGAIRARLGEFQSRPLPKRQP